MSSSQQRLHSAWIEEGNDSKFRVSGYRWNSLKLFFAWTGIVLSLGFLRLIFYWRPKWHVLSMCEPSSLLEADIVFVTDEHKRETMRPVRVSDPNADDLVLPCKGGVFTPVKSYRFFTFRKLKYIWHPKYHAFCSAFPLDEQVPLKSFEKWGHKEEGLSNEKYLQRLGVYGENSITVKLKPIWKLLFLEVISPFYIFQIFSVIIWFSDEYVYYATVIVLISALSIAADVYQTRSTEKKLRDMVHSVDMVTCIRDGQSVNILSNGLVPGDIMIIPKHGCIMQCDAVLLTGTCIVNESMLTGESVPVTKTSLPLQEETSSQGSAFEPIYTNKEHGKHTLFCGTHILQTRYYSKAPVKALVIRTGYSTMKGQLVRSIMYPKPVDFQFTKDLLRFVGVLCCIAFVGFSYTIIIMILRGNEVSKIILRSLDVITIVVPPALPAAMTIGILAAQMRLQKKRIHCISPSTINTCGGINLVCFDKTGTLTEDGLDFNCILPAGPGTSETGTVVFGDEKGDLDEVDHEQNEIVQAMASCHSLTRIDGEICGDPMDLILFRQTEWLLEEPEVVEESGRFDMMAPTSVRPPKGLGQISTSNSSGEGGGFSIGILRQFTFSSELQRMSVMVRRMGEKDLMIFCKGAPETVASLCDPATVPKSFASSLKRYARKGYRVLGVAKRNIHLSFVKAQRIPRDQVECDLEFLGLVVLENRLKPETQPVIQQLLRAQIRPVMVTGDNLLTAVSVARECGVLDSRKTIYMLETGEKNVEGHTKLYIRREDQQKSEGITDNSFGSGSSSYLPSSSSSIDLESNPVQFGAHYQLAMTGATFAVVSKEYPGLLNRLVCVCNVFARMSPDQKAQLVGALQGLDHIVAMCGDGANDCGALKAAHAGISLSEAEASIASPFTSQTPNITCVPTVIREGRAALVTSFGIFKYMAGYSMTQFCSVCLLYWIATNLADFQFLYIDLFLITVFAVFFGYTDAAENLVPQPPPTRILSLPSIASIILQLAIIMGIQIFSFAFVTTQPWFVPFTDPGEEDNYFSYQGTVLFWTSVYQYIGLAIIYSKSYPYRKPLFNNRLLTASLVIMTLISVWWTLYPPKLINEWLNLMEPPFMHYRALILVIAGVGFILSYLVETWVVEYLLFEKAAERKWFQRTRQQPKHLDILEEIGETPAWLQSALEGRNRVPSGTWDKISSPSSPGASSADEERDLLRKQRSRKISTEL